MNFEVDISDEGKQGFAVAIYSKGTDVEEGALEFGRSGIEGKQAVLQYISECFDSLLEEEHEPDELK